MGRETRRYCNNILYYYSANNRPVHMYIYCILTIYVGLLQVCVCVCVSFGTNVIIRSTSKTSILSRIYLLLPACFLSLSVSVLFANRDYVHTTCINIQLWMIFNADHAMCYRQSVLYMTYTRIPEEIKGRFTWSFHHIRFLWWTILLFSD